MRLSVLALSLTLSPVLAAGRPGFGEPSECKTPAIANCLRLIDLISHPNWRDLSFPIHPGGFSPVAYYGDCALAAIYIGGVEDETVIQSFGEAAGIVQGMVDAGFEEDRETPIAHDVKLDQHGLFSLALTVSTGDLEAWEGIVDGCMEDLIMGRGRAKPNQDEPSIFSLDSKDRSYFDQQSIPDRLPNCGLVGIFSIDGSRHGCNAQVISGPLTNYQEESPRAEISQTNPFTELLGRCPDSTHWQCRSLIDAIICYCVKDKADKSIIAPHDANVTKLEILAQLVPGNNDTVISLFNLKCSKDEIVSCRRVLPRPYVCGCFPEPQADDSGEGPCHEDRAPPLELRDRREPQIRQMADSDLQFQLIQWPTCSGGVQFKCCTTKGVTACYCGKGKLSPKKQGR
ncbi:MAG: hypothetical protein M1813_001750 [Trichoglossum hirsutum]|nr:MAG: hypothetical protein M1813_001750 [Trichoglossum hirsutum]